MKHALICGVTGQDGAYLSQLLLNKDYIVYGTSRDAHISNFENVLKLGIRQRVNTISMAPNDFRSVLQTISQTEPDEIYNLSGQSSVGLSFEQPVETMDSISNATLNILEAIRFLGTKIRFYSSSSSECFGDVAVPASESTPFSPRSPYAVAKAAAHWLVANYREAYGLFACSGITFNHESNLRPERFVTRKIVETARRISEGSDEKLQLGNIEIIRDWGWAPEYVEAMWQMLQQDEPQDFVLATGISSSLVKFVETTFDLFDMDWRDHVVVRKELFRPSDLTKSLANPTKAREILGWWARSGIDDVVRNMVDQII